jgi:RNA polymerase sigma-70 factor (ECF subfamily)
VTAFAVRRWPNDAEDLVARAFEIAWRRWGDRPEELHAGLLIGIVRNLARNLNRSQQRQTVLTGRLAGTTDTVAAPDPAETDLGSAVLEVLARLSGDDQLVLTLVAWDDADTATIAHVLGVSRTAARVRLHRARRRFEAVYLAHHDEEGSA